MSKSIITDQIEFADLAKWGELVYSVNPTKEKFCVLSAAATALFYFIFTLI